MNRDAGAARRALDGMIRKVRVATAAVERTDRLFGCSLQEHPYDMRLLATDPVRARVHRVLDEQPRSVCKREVLSIEAKHGAILLDARGRGAGDEPECSVLA